MRKYLAVFKVTWQYQVEYRFEVLSHLILGLMSFFVFVFVWSAIFKQRPTFNGYTLSSMITYLVMVRVLHFLTRGNTSRIIAHQIKDGYLSIHLIKPFSCLKYWFSEFLADRLFETLVRGILMIIFLLMIPTYFQIGSISNFVHFLFFIPLALMINFLINILVATMAFYVTDIRIFNVSFGLITGFLAGQVVPVDLFPGILRRISILLPFQYNIFFPIKIIQGNLDQTELIKGFLSALAWIIMLAFLVKWSWSRGIKKYEATGQ